MKKLLKTMPKTNYIIIMLFLILLISVMIPSLARYKNRPATNEVTVWDGSVATSYRKGTGTSDDPYIISNGSEFAYFASMLKTTDYSNTYFELNNDIILNDGTFIYDDEGIKYKLNNTIFYVKEYTDEIYDNVDRTGTKIKSINLFESLDNFKGNLNGKSYRIYGLYITSTNENVSLFTNLSGNITNLYVENSMIYGGSVTAGIASNATNSNLENILYNGYVVGINSSNKTETLDIVASSLTNINIPYSDIINVTVKGNIGNNTILINDNSVTGEINLDLGSINEIIVDTNVSVNLTYDVTYKTNITSGIVGVADNITLNNVINKADIIGEFTSGLVGYTNDITINNSYSNGLSNSGLINTINGIANINKSYSSNSNYLINNMIDSDITINNSFATNTKFILNNINESNVTFNNSYYTDGEVTNNKDVSGDITLTDITNLQNKEFVINNLQFKEFVDNYDNENIWVYEEGCLPILAIDDITNPIASIYLGTYNWNNLGYDLNTIRFNNTTAFSIKENDPLKPLNEVYYYISDKELTKAEIENITWTPYENIVEIKDEGKYVIYAKVVSDNTYYLNTDIIVLDFSKADSVININNKQFDTLKDNLDYLYIDDTTSFTITATDDLSGIKSIEYYISNEILSEEQLNNVTWLEYKEGLSIDTTGKYIIYAKVIDNMDYVTYINTDYIVYDGYNISIDNSNITNNSIVTLNVKYSADLEYKGTHNLVSNISFPINTKITLIDNVKNKVYTYEVTETKSCEKCYYPFTSFKEVGSIDKFYQESSGNINDDYTILIDFNNSSSYENVQVYLELLDNETFIPTLKQNIKVFNVYSDKDSYPYINTNYSGTIDMSSDSTTNIDINAGLFVNRVNDKIIKDTTYNNKLLGIAIKLVDSENNIVNKEYLKNIKFIIDNQIYSPSDDGIVRINLNSIEDINKTLTIETSKDSVKLNGNYYFKIASYYAYDGTFTNQYSSEITIPVSSNIENNPNYYFDVEMDNTISKNDEIINFNILTDLDNPNVLITLYKKTEFTAYNQDYVLIDLGNYATNLEQVSDKVYKLTSNQLNIKNFTSGGYEFVFEFYDNDRKIGTIEKKFIVR